MKKTGMMGMGALLAGALALTGCMGSARIFFQDGNGGTLVLEGDEGKAMEDGQKKMGEHCGPRGFHIVKRETVVVGSENYTNKDKQYAEKTEAARVAQTNQQGHEDATVAQNSQAHVTRTGASESSAGYAEANSESQTTTAEAAEAKTHGHENESTVSGTRQVTEQRVTYACGTADAPQQ